MYNCQQCEKNPGIKDMLGHDGPPQSLWEENLITGVPLARCPIRDLLDAPAPLRTEFDRIKTLYYPQFKLGNLLTGGGLASQPARYIEAMTTLAMLEKQQETKWKEIKPDPTD